MGYACSDEHGITSSLEGGTRQWHPIHVRLTVQGCTPSATRCGRSTAKATIGSALIRSPGAHSKSSVSDDVLPGHPANLLLKQHALLIIPKKITIPAKEMVPTTVMNAMPTPLPTQSMRATPIVRKAPHRQIRLPCENKQRTVITLLSAPLDAG